MKRSLFCFHTNFLINTVFDFETNKIKIKSLKKNNVFRFKEMSFEYFIVKHEGVYELFVLGAHCGRGILRLNGKTQKLEIHREVRIPRKEYAMVYHKGRLYLCGGCENEIYRSDNLIAQNIFINMFEGSISESDPIPNFTLHSPRANPCAFVFLDRYICVLGGQERNVITYKNMEIFDTENNFERALVDIHIQTREERIDKSACGEQLILNNLKAYKRTSDGTKESFILFGGNRGIKCMSNSLAKRLYFFQLELEKTQDGFKAVFKPYALVDYKTTPTSKGYGNRRYQTIPNPTV